MRHALMVGSLLFVAVAAGCSSSPALRTEPSTSAIRAAEEVGASDVPRAALHLQLAKEELDRARTLSDNGKKDEAASQLLRAEADAELAVLLSREQTEKAEAAQAMERVRQLQSDNR
jgi:regulator of protease activity HflC (stomatin/prohibitin superfamily)